MKNSEFMDLYIWILKSKGVIDKDGSFTGEARFLGHLQ